MLREKDRSEEPLVLKYCWTMTSIIPAHGPHLLRQMGQLLEGQFPHPCVSLFNATASHQLIQQPIVFVTLCLYPTHDPMIMLMELSHLIATLWGTLGRKIMYWILRRRFSRREIFCPFAHPKSHSGRLGHHPENHGMDRGGCGRKWKLLKIGHRHLKFKVAFQFGRGKHRGAVSFAHTCLEFISFFGKRFLNHFIKSFIFFIFLEEAGVLIA